MTVVEKLVVKFVKEFTRNRDLSGRLQLPSDRNSYVCCVCGKHFHTAQYLRVHMNIHDSKYQCTECGKCFINNRLLTIHKEFIWDRNRLNVAFVINDLHRLETFERTAEFTVERNRTNVTCVRRRFVGLNI